MFAGQKSSQSQQNTAAVVASKTATIYCDCSNSLSISKNFYENLGIGGNSNIWGGYINYSKLK